MKKVIGCWLLAVGGGLAAFGALLDNPVSATSPTMAAATNVVASETPPDKPDGEGGGGEGGGETQPDKPDGEGGEGGGETPPDKPDGEGEGEGGDTPPGGDSSGSEDSVLLTGAYTYTSETNTLAGATLASTTSDQNVILAQTNAYVTVSNCVLNKSGDTSNADNSNFFALNAVVAAKTAATVCVDHSTLNSNAEGANCLFASGEGSTIYAYDCTLTSTKDSSRGLDATYEGTVIASKMTINTSGDHCAAFATDRGNGYISATDSTLATAGQGSPLVYSTGVIEVNGVTGTATGAQIAGIEGLSTIRIKNSSLSGSGKKASEPVVNGVIIYQSMSGDSTEGTATFEVSDSTLTTAITNGALFYITNSKADIRVQNTILDFDSDKNYLLNAAGNDGSNGWGTAGANGGEVIFTAIDQTLSGKIAVDGISSLDLYLTNATYTGTFVQDSTNAGDGDVNAFLSADSTWVVTASCTLQNLTVAPGAKIMDGSGNTVSIVNTNGTMHVTGTSTLTITVSDYTSGDVSVPYAITDFEIDRTAFEAMYGTSQSETITPGVASEPYSDAQSATNAAARINADKAGSIIVPTGVEGDAVDTYLSMIEATVTSDNRVVIDLTPEAQSNEQVVVDAALTNETVVAALVSTNVSAKVSIATTTPGLYYWIAGGTDVTAVTTAGAGVLSTDGGSVELAKPALDTTQGRAFFRIAAGVAAPTPSTDD